MYYLWFLVVAEFLYLFCCCCCCDDAFVFSFTHSLTSIFWLHWLLRFDFEVLWISFEYFCWFCFWISILNARQCRILRRIVNCTKWMYDLRSIKCGFFFLQTSKFIRKYFTRYLELIEDKTKKTQGKNTIYANTINSREVVLWVWSRLLLCTSVHSVFSSAFCLFIHLCFLYFSLSRGRLSSTSHKIICIEAHDWD